MILVGRVVALSPPPESHSRTSGGWQFAACILLRCAHPILAHQKAVSAMGRPRSRWQWRCTGGVGTESSPVPGNSRPAWTVELPRRIVLVYEAFFQRETPDSTERCVEARSNPVITAGARPRLASGHRYWHVVLRTAESVRAPALEVQREPAEKRSGQGRRAAHRGRVAYARWRSTVNAPADRRGGRGRAGAGEYQLQR